MSDELENNKAPVPPEPEKAGPAQVERGDNDRRSTDRRADERRDTSDPTDDISRKLAAKVKAQADEEKRVERAQTDRRDKDRRRVTQRRKQIIGEEEELKAKKKQEAEDKRLKGRRSKAKKRVTERKHRRKRRRAMIKKIIGWTVPLIYLTLLFGIIYGVVVYWPKFAKMLS